MVLVLLLVAMVVVVMVAVVVMVEVTVEVVEVVVVVVAVVVVGVVLVVVVVVVMVAVCDCCYRRAPTIERVKTPMSRSEEVASAKRIRIAVAVVADVVRITIITFINIIIDMIIVITIMIVIIIIREWASANSYIASGCRGGGRGCGCCYRRALTIEHPLTSRSEEAAGVKHIRIAVVVVADVVAAVDGA